MADTKREDAAAYVILDSALNGKGVSAQTNPMEKPEDEAKAVFDELSKDIIIPAFNKFVLFMAAQLGMIDMTKDADKPISAAMQTALDKKQDREKRTGSETLYKVLTDNNFTDEAAEQLAAAFAALHEHANKALLDGLTQDDIDNWNGANVLTKDNTTPYEPRGEYQPATVRFVLDRVVGDWGGRHAGADLRPTEPAGGHLRGDGQDSGGPAKGNGRGLGECKIHH
ncbi:MAG: hypothetical protein ACLUD9_03205 [Anaerotignum faecicola]